MAYELFWEPHGVYKRFYGTVSFQEYARSQEQVLCDYRTDSLKYVINDFSDVTGYAATTSEVEYSAAFNRATAMRNPALVVAYVTTDAKVISLIKIASFVSSLTLKHFPNLADARTWVQEVAAHKD